MKQKHKQIVGAILGGIGWFLLFGFAPFRIILTNQSLYEVFQIGGLNFIWLSGLIIFAYVGYKIAEEYG